MRPLLLVLLTSLHQVICQPLHPALPTEDYLIVSSLVNRFVNCNQKQVRRYALPDERCLLFIRPITDVRDVDQYKLSDMKEAALNDKMTSFRPDTSWKTFFTSVKPEQYGKYTVENKLPLPGKQMVLWTDELEDRYFGKSGKRTGFFGLREAYKQFAAIISFSNVVYSTDRTKAVCYFGEVSDGESGAGYLVFLEKTGDGWLIAGSQML